MCVRIFYYTKHKKKISSPKRHCNNNNKIKFWIVDEVSSEPYNKKKMIKYGKKRAHTRLEIPGVLCISNMGEYLKLFLDYNIFWGYL